MKTIAYKVEKIIFERLSSEEEKKVWFDSMPELLVQIKDENDNIKSFEISDEQYKEFLQKNVKLVSVRKVSKERKRRYSKLFPNHYVEFVANDYEKNQKEFKIYLNQYEYETLKKHSTYYEKKSNNVLTNNTQ